jgi:hypothetical protein
MILEIGDEKERIRELSNPQNADRTEMDDENSILQRSYVRIENSSDKKDQRLKKKL